MATRTQAAGVVWRRVTAVNGKGCAGLCDYRTTRCSGKMGISALALAKGHMRGFAKSRMPSSVDQHDAVEDTIQEQAACLRLALTTEQRADGLRPGTVSGKRGLIATRMRSPY